MFANAENIFKQNWCCFNLKQYPSMKNPLFKQACQATPGHQIGSYIVFYIQQASSDLSGFS